MKTLQYLIELEVDETHCYWNQAGMYTSGALRHAIAHGLEQAELASRGVVGSRVSPALTAPSPDEVRLRSWVMAELYTHLEKQKLEVNDPRALGVGMFKIDPVGLSANDILTTLPIDKHGTYIELTCRAVTPEDKA